MEDPADPGTGSASTEDSGKHKAPLDGFADVELGGLPAIAPDGGFAPQLPDLSPSVPAANPDLFICLRGPCRHYMQIETFFASGNPKDTWDDDDGLRDPETNEPVRMPRQITRTCLVHPGTETELTDDIVYDCNRWSPMTSREVRRETKRRSKYLKLHPDHRR